MPGRGKDRQRARGKLRRIANKVLSDLFGGEDTAFVHTDCRDFAKKHPGVEPPDVERMRSTRRKKRFRSGRMEEE